VCSFQQKNEGKKEIENELGAYEKRKEKKPRMQEKKTYYKEEKTNRQHATICQSSRNRNDIFSNIYKNL